MCKSIVLYLHHPYRGGEEGYGGRAIAQRLADIGEVLAVASQVEIKSKLESSSLS